MNTHFRKGVELLNAERYFEAHEVLEDVWRAAPPQGKVFYQGMVQIAVALHHYSRGNLKGARSVLERAVRNVSDMPQGFAGIDLDGLRSQLREWSKCTQEGSAAPPWPKIQWQVKEDNESKDPASGNQVG